MKDKGYIRPQNDNEKDNCFNLYSPKEERNIGA